jgi:hypothetical protein
MVCRIDAGVVGGATAMTNMPALLVVKSQY